MQMNITKKATRLAVCLTVLLGFGLTGCAYQMVDQDDVSNAIDACKDKGGIVEIEVIVDPFTSIDVFDKFRVNITQGATQQVILKAGSNQINDIKYQVMDNKLTLRDENSCNWLRNLEFPTVNITHPNLTELRISGGGTIMSEDTLSYPELKLVSEDVSGDFILKVNCNNLSVVNNQLSNYWISGRTDYLFVGVYAGNGRFEGADLEAENVEIFHRGLNDIVVHAKSSISGEIVHLGNIVYVKTVPPVINVTKTGRGNLCTRR